jgi:hypothetical protein
LVTVASHRHRHRRHAIFSQTGRELQSQAPEQAKWQLKRWVLVLSGTDAVTCAGSNPPRPSADEILKRRIRTQVIKQEVTFLGRESRTTSAHNFFQKVESLVGLAQTGIDRGRRIGRSRGLS